MENPPGNTRPVAKSPRPPVGHSAWVEVRLSALKHNLAQVRGLVGPSVKIMAVVKANAYGHGAVEASKAFVEAGAEYLGVTTIEEGLELRAGGISTSTLIFSPLLPDQFEAAISHDLDQTICSPEMAGVLSKTAAKLGKQARVHVKVDTGMHRLGVIMGQAPEFIRRLLDLPSIEIAGTYTHFANAGAKDLAHAWGQDNTFGDLIDILEAQGIPAGLCHAANSAAILNLPGSWYEMVRPGTILYGQYPTRFVEKKLDLQDTWQLKTRIVALSAVPKGAKVGYGSEFIAKRVTTAAVLPIGYADGFTLLPQSLAQRAHPLRAVAGRMLGQTGSPHVIIKGKQAPVIGRVSMQMCSVDVTDIPGVEIGEEVIVPTRRVTTSSWIPRVYIE